MPIFANLTAHAVEEFAGLDHRGAEFYALVVKATFRWTREGRLEPEVAAPVTVDDVHPGDPATTGPVLESDLVPSKPRIDVILAGRIALPVAVKQVDVTLAIGSRLRKTVRIFGERRWMPGLVRKLALTDAKPFSEMPIVWERSSGGTDPRNPEVVDRRNPCGRGVRKHTKDLVGMPGANFEDPRHPIRAWDDRPPPVGLGPVGRHWEPRVQWTGTYDARWQEDVFPLLPEDFDLRFYNCAPLDQQLDGYRPGEEVRLTYMTTAGHDRFRLPVLSTPVTLVTRGGRRETRRATPDTIIIEPADRRVSLVARALFHPVPDIFAVREVVVGGEERPAATRVRA